MDILGRDRAGEPAGKRRGEAPPAFDDLVQRALAGSPAAQGAAFHDDPVPQFLQRHRTGLLGKVRQIQGDRVGEAGVRNRCQPGKRFLRFDLLRVGQTPCLVGVVAQFRGEGVAEPLREGLFREILPPVLRGVLFAQVLRDAHEPPARFPVDLGGDRFEWRGATAHVRTVHQRGANRQLKAISQNCRRNRRAEIEV